MFSARATHVPRRRAATRAWLRALATLVALFLGLSSLGQSAHFLLVPHAICAEHGELLEVQGAGHTAGHGAAHAAEPDHPASSPTASSPVAAEHEHCQVLARGQRERAEPAPPAAWLAPARTERVAAAASAVAIPRPAIASLSLAPKTSPPSAVFG